MFGAAACLDAGAVGVDAAGAGYANEPNFMVHHRADFAVFDANWRRLPPLSDSEGEAGFEGIEVESGEGDSSMASYMAVRRSTLRWNHLRSVRACQIGALARRMMVCCVPFACRRHLLVVLLHPPLDPRGVPYRRGTGHDGSDTGVVDVTPICHAEPTVGAPEGVDGLEASRGARVDILEVFVTSEMLIENNAGQSRGPADWHNPSVSKVEDGGFRGLSAVGGALLLRWCTNRGLPVRVLAIVILARVQVIARGGAKNAKRSPTIGEILRRFFLDRPWVN
ncbi:hypothetical protein NUU61_001332 [Penicillium alfredii]|uniref:Uncharacterized protein n=1 Tax=Penicillium alfredii TaxID=1506179 RepID=A0A9W9G473_9EURO|nr:uncharacterized protein NUU61_001332 [Penicillium alfredii]KAJ5111702.1 hypothetical protein NUU61_001332 [Penicillium alfredii]